jgi:DNA-binding NarL/FixJ family response regulator
VWGNRSLVRSSYTPGLDGWAAARNALFFGRVPSQPISVYIADAQPIVRHGLQLVLAAESGLEVIGAASTAEQLKRNLGQLEPEVLFLDTGLRAPWLDLLREVLALRPALKVIVSGTNVPDDEVVAALELGARGVLPRDAAVDLFGRCARAVAGGQYWIGRQAMGGLVETLRRARTQPQRPEQQLSLTSRQLDVIRAVADSQTNRQIAAALGISEDTVKQHLTAVFDKCGVSNRVELALFAVRNGLID